MKSLILIAHGSRREASNAEIQALTGRLQARVSERYGLVACAFLELAQPSIPVAVDRAVHAGSLDITLLPYFLARGVHIAEDIPNLVADKRAQYPTVSLNLKPYIGAAPAIMDLLVSVV